ncbi:MAG: hypothetical protein AAF902_08200 [Chloroflexota bacterium]
MEKKYSLFAPYIRLVPGLKLVILFFIIVSTIASVNHVVAQTESVIYMPLIRNDANFNSFYVSKNGDNSDGQTWKTAWNEMDQIDWGILNPGDHVFVDGGAYSMTYRTPIIPQKNGHPGKPIVVQLSAEVGRDGRAILFGGNSIPLPECGQKVWDDSEHIEAGLAGIHLINEIKHIKIDGRKRGGIQVHGWREFGIKFYPDTIDNGLDDNPSYITLQYLEIYNNGGVGQKNDGVVQDLYYPLSSGAGVKLAGSHHLLQYLEVHDNAGDAVQSAFTNPSGGVFNNMDNLTILDSWFYNQRPHSGIDNSPPGEVCGVASQSGCDELGAPSMSIDYLYYPQEYPNRKEMFNWCTHPDGVQIFSSNDFNNMTVKRTFIGPNFMNGMILGDDVDANHTAWVNNLTLEDVVITRFTHNAVGMNGPEGQAGESWDFDRVTIYGHYSSTNKDTVTLDSDALITEHSISNSVMVFGRTKFLDGNIAFDNNCEHRLYSGSISGREIDPRFGLIRNQDLFEDSLNRDFATVFVENYSVNEPACAQTGSSVTSISDLLERFNQE